MRKLLNRSKTLFYLIIFIIFSLQTVFSQDSLQLNYDNSYIEIKPIPKEKIAEYRTDSDFQYEREIVKKDGIGNDIMYWISRFLGKIFSNEGSIPHIRLFILILFGIFITLRILKINVTTLFYKNKKQVPISVFIEDENIHELNLEQIIKKAKKEKDFRKATRYLYLFLLKKMSDSKIIKWKINKTNSEYLIEVSKTKYKKHFLHLTSTYEYVWYGNFEINETVFDEINNEFNLVFQTIKH